MTTFKIYHGNVKPMVAVGEHQCRLLGFAWTYPGWHSSAPDRTTRRAVNALHRKGYLEVNEYNQFRLQYPSS
jgi:hypothetical protein